MSVQKIIDEWVESCRAREALQRQQSLDMQAESLANPHEEKLRRIIANNSQEEAEQLGGMAGGLQLFARIYDDRFYKKRAAEKLLQARHTKRWHALNPGYSGKQPHTNVYCQSLYEDAAYCRKRALGIIAPTPVSIINL